MRTFFNAGTIEAPILARICLPTKRIPMIIALELHFQDQRFELSASGSLYVIISQTATDRSNIAIVNT